MSRDPKDRRPDSIFAPRATAEDDWRRLQNPEKRVRPPRLPWPLENILIIACAGLAVVASAWGVSRGGREVGGDERSAPAIVTLVTVPDGQSLQDVCAAYGLPAALCDLSERCAAQTPRRDGRVALVLRSDGEACGSPPP